MKGLLLVVGFSMASFNSTAQVVYHAYETGMAILDTGKSGWTYSNAKPTNLTVTLKEKYKVVDQIVQKKSTSHPKDKYILEPTGDLTVSLNGRDKSTYRLKGEYVVERTEDNEDRRDWDALDKTGRNCEFSVIHFRNNTVRIQITYSNFKYLASFFYNVTEVSK